MGPQEIPGEVVNFVQGIVDQIINPIIGILFAAALVLFLYGLLVFILNAGEQAKREAGKSHLLWGIIGMTVMVSVYAILSVGLATFGISGGGDGGYPDEIDYALQ